MKLYISWHKKPSMTVGMTTLPMDGPFIGSDVIDFSTGGALSKNAPAGADYCEVWADAACWVQYGPGLAAAPVAGAPTAKPLQALQRWEIEDIGALSTVVGAVAFT